MAVPKKRTSHSKKNSRYANWVNKVNKIAKNALSLAKSCVKKKSTNLIYILKVNKNRD